MFKRFVLALALVVVGFALPASAQTVTDLYLAGGSASPGSKPAVAVTGFYSHALTDSTHAFTVVDVLPGASGTVTTSIGAGIAQRVATIGKVPIYIPTAAGISLSGSNAGWSWSTGVGAPFRLKGSWYAMPIIRVRKSSIGGDGYTAIPGVLFGWGKTK